MREVRWINRPVGDCLDASFAGEWGTEPNPPNAVVLRATDIDDEGHVVGFGAIRSIPMSKLREKQLRDGDILLEGSGGGPDKPVGRVALFEADAHIGPAICSNFFKTLRPKRQIVNERFLWRKLGWFYGQPALLALQQQTTGIINLKFAEYLDARIDVPAELQEQSKIAAVLDTLDTTIRQTEAIIEKLKQVKQGLLHDLLTRGIDANGALRPPQSEAPHLYKDSALGWIPIEWQVLPLGRTIADAYRYPSYFGIEYVDSGVPEVRGELIQADGTLDVRAENYRHISSATAANFLRVVLKPDDVVMTVRGTIGKFAIVPRGLEGAVITANLLKLTPDRAVVRADWLIRLLLSQRFQDPLDAACSLTTIKTIQVPELMAIRIGVPSLTEQAAVNHRLRVVDDLNATEQAMLEKLRVLKSGLMDDLLTGRVRVTPLLAAAATT